ncbi:hypothetical protein [Propioniciclava soli]|uniref:hypothetical protein n=1 Tax=Propioniciclava soli TaxID=2775081 RepID=UPI001E598CDB|nr:hypothetical protein [Propioniciclava soli]
MSVLDLHPDQLIIARGVQVMSVVRDGHGYFSIGINGRPAIYVDRSDLTELKHWLERHLPEGGRP